MLIRHLKVSGLLSFGPKGIDLPMRNLNVLIGPNGSGKSNFIEVLNVLRHAPVRLDSPIMTGGGVQEWLWKGSCDDPPCAKISVEVVGNLMDQSCGFCHSLEFGQAGDQVMVRSESVTYGKSSDAAGDAAEFYSLKNGHAMVQDGQLPGQRPRMREIESSKLDSRVSILSQMKDPDRYRVFDFLQRAYSGIHIYREWTFGPASRMRSSQALSSATDSIGRGGENVFAVVASMKRPERNRLVDELRTLYDEIVDVRVGPTAGNGLRLFIEEKGGMEISSERLSDGTLRFLFLLAILLQPEPPPLIVIEEPELGLHPDVIPRIAALLVEASQRTQLVVTTHSRMLIDALGEDPECVVVCEKHDGESTFERLDGERMAAWLENYSLGDLWSKGEIGGNRW